MQMQSRYPTLEELIVEDVSCEWDDMESLLEPELPEDVDAESGPDRKETSTCWPPA